MHTPHGASRIRILRGTWVPIVLAYSCLLQPEPAMMVEPCPDTPLLAAVRETGTLRVLVSLNVETRPEAELSAEQIADQRRRIAEVGAELVAEVDVGSIRVVRSYQTQPRITLEVDEPALCRLLESPRVSGAAEDEALPPAGGS